jgi:hypothetical protein
MPITSASHAADLAVAAHHKARAAADALARLIPRYPRECAAVHAHVGGAAVAADLAVAASYRPTGPAAPAAPGDDANVALRSARRHAAAAVTGARAILTLAALLDGDDGAR